MSEETGNSWNLQSSTLSSAARSRLVPIVDVQRSPVVYAGLSNPNDIVFEIFQSVWNFDGFLEHSLAPCWPCKGVLNVGCLCSANVRILYPCSSISK